MQNDLEPVCIVIADDDADDRFLMEDAFHECPIMHELKFVEDGEELLELLHGDGRYANGDGNICPNLVLLDLNMPKMDGRQTLKAIREDVHLKHIPVVILTTSVSDEDVTSAYSSGANSYISKPGTFEDMLEMTHTLAQYWGNIVRQPPMQ